jgi:hypothetical protein
VLHVDVEGDRVVIDLCGRRRDVLLGCGDAERLARGLRAGADRARRAPPELARGERWDARVESYDGFVALRFLPPAVGAPGRVPLTPAAAEKLADLVDFKRQQAAYKMRFVFA